MNEFHVGEPRRAYVISVQVMHFIRGHDPQLAEVIEECDVSRLVHAALEGCDSLRLRSDLQEAVEELRTLMGGMQSDG